MEKDNEKGMVRCPKCGAEDSQMKNGRNRSGMRTILCRHCKKAYTPEPKRHAYSEETKAQALKTYYSGVSGRGVGKIFGMSKFLCLRGAADVSRGNSKHCGQLSLCSWMHTIGLARRKLSLVQRV